MADKEFKKGLITGILITVCISTGISLGIGYVSKDSILSDKQCVKKIKLLENLIDTYYLDETDEEQLKEGLYTGLVYGLGDPYSRYYTAQEYESENTSTEGSYVGAGILIQKNPDGGILVSHCYEGGPAEKAGIKEGDIISAIDRTDITDSTTTEVSAMIKGRDGDTITFTVHRENEENPLEIPILIQDVELPSVFHEMLNDKIGYVRISEFKGVTVSQYDTAFRDLESKGMERLIIDLRDNPGGLLNSVCDILRNLLPEGLIVYTEDKYGNRTEETCDGQHPINLPLAVLVNESSASASEIFAGAVQDYGIGTIVGTTTYGKGIVQSIRQLSDGSAVKLTVSNYYTPNGNNIHQTGIKPDIEVKLDANLLNKDEFSHEEDNQLQEAIKAVKDTL